MPSRNAPAWPATPPPAMVARTSNLSAVSVTASLTFVPPATTIQGLIQRNVTLKLSHSDGRQVEQNRAVFQLAAQTPEAGCQDAAVIRAHGQAEAGQGITGPPIPPRLGDQPGLVEQFVALQHSSRSSPLVVIDTSGLAVPLTPLVSAAAALVVGSHGSPVVTLPVKRSAAPFTSGQSTSCSR